ncbi:MAG: DUF11 domain-containing protein [Anaerolineales bacterium]|nr:DUF11 domain-containing protein [Anaerolineales bacterium]
MGLYDLNLHILSRPSKPILLAALPFVFSGLLLSIWFNAIAAPAFDLAINKSQIPTIFTVSTNNRYAINVTRTNTETVTESPRVEDVLPEGMTVTTIKATDTAGAWDCSTSTVTLVSCVWSQSIPSSLTTFPAIIIGVNVAPDIPDVTVTNTAVLLTQDVNISNNSASVATTVDSVDLQISKTVDQIYIEPGELFTYTLTISNAGPSDATNVEVIDTLSSLVEYFPILGEPINPSQGWYDPLTGIWEVGELPKGASARLEIPASPITDAAGHKIANSAAVTSTNTSDWQLSNNSDSADVIVTGLEITKTFEPATSTCEAFDPTPCYYVGEPIAFTIEVYNNSDLAASSVVVSDAFTPTLDILDYYYSIKNNSGIVIGTYGPYSSSRNFSRTFGTLKPHYTLSITINTRLNSTFDEIKEITNIAKVTASPSVICYSDEVKLYIKPAIDLVLTKTDSRTTVYAGGTYTYTVSIQNIGTYATITNIIFTDTFSANVSDIVLTKGALSMTLKSVSGNTIVWKIGEFIDPDESISFKVRGKVLPSAAAGEQVINTAIIRLVKPEDTSTGQFESYTGNNTITDIDTVLTPAIVDLAIYKSATGKIWKNGWIDVPNLVTPGQLLTYKLLVINHGEALAINVVVKDFMPTGMTILAINPSQGACFTGVQGDPTKPYSCYLNNIEGGSEANITILVLIPSSAPLGAMYYNFATVTNNVSDAYLENNEALNITSVNNSVFLQFLSFLITVLH